MGNMTRNEEPGFSWCTVIGPLYAGEEPAWAATQPGDLLICADGGYGAARRLGLKPELLIGDFDSLPASEAPDDGEAEGLEVIRLPVCKDDTDLVACVKEGRRRGFRRFRILGCLGGRLDHTLAAVQVAYDCALRGEEAWLADERNRLTVLLPGEHFLSPLPGRKLSLLALTPEVTGIDLEGTQWPLRDATLTARFPLGCSNEPLTERVWLRFQAGALILCYAAEDEQKAETAAEGGIPWHRP